MPIGLDAFLGEAILKAKLDGCIKDLLIDWDTVVAYNEALRGCLGRSN